MLSQILQTSRKVLESFLKSPVVREAMKKFVLAAAAAAGAVIGRDIAERVTNKA